MGRGLVGDQVGQDVALQQIGEDARGIADEADGARLAGLDVVPHAAQRVFGVFGDFVDVTMVQLAAGAGLVHFHDQGHAVVHGDGQRLRPAHLAQPGRQRPLAAQRRPAGLSRRGSERLEGALQNALRADVDPAPGRHLAVHDQPFGLPAVEVLLGGPVGHDVGVGDEHARGVGVSAEDGHRLAALDKQRLVVFQLAQAAQDGVEGLPVAGRPAAAAVDDQVLRVVGHLGVEVVLDHAIGGLLQPAFTVELGAARGANGAGHKSPRSKIERANVLLNRLAPFAAPVGPRERMIGHGQVQFATYRFPAL